MAAKIGLQDGINVFIEFQIIKNSPIDSLSKELDILIAAGKRIHLWSKTVSPEDMEKYCKSVKVPVPKEEKELHEKIWKLRHVDRKTFSEISSILKVPISKISYFSRTSPKEGWTLADWIVSYERKDSSIYPKVDFVVDTDPKLVERFRRAGRIANLLTKVE